MLKFVSFHEPPPALARYVQFFFVLEDAGRHSLFGYDIVPVGDISIVHATLTWADGERRRPGLDYLLLNGAFPRVKRVLVTPRQVVGARLKVGAYRAIFGASAQAIRDRTVFMRTIWGPHADELAHALHEADGEAGRLTVLTDALARRAGSFAEPDSTMAKAVELVEASAGTLTVEELAARLGYTERQVHRKFDEDLGLTPKEYQRMWRCRRVILRMLNRDFESWTDLASDFGYCDQAHLIREFKGFMGMSPERFLKNFATQGRILDSPVPGLRDETALLGYGGSPSSPRPPAAALEVEGLPALSEISNTAGPELR